jgi:hypothetical protein
MLALAATAHASIGDAETITIIGAIVAALFWKFLVKIGLALLAIGILSVIGTFLYMVVTGLQALVR